MRLVKSEKGGSSQAIGRGRPTVTIINAGLRARIVGIIPAA
jgi:hypothetical protein